MSQAEGTIELARVRMLYARGEELRYISHLDMQMVWERTIRRASLPLAYSQGFNPKPRMHQAAALPLGFLSRGEITDIWLKAPTGELDLDDLAARVQAAAPPGLRILNIQAVSLQEPALQTQVHSAEYLATPYDPQDPDALAQGLSRLLETASLPRERRGKAYDLRPLIEALELRPAGEQSVILFMRLSAREGATGRPEEVLDALGLDPAAFRVERVALIL